MPFFFCVRHEEQEQQTTEEEGALYQKKKKRKKQRRPRYWVLGTVDLSSLSFTAVSGAVNTGCEQNGPQTTHDHSTTITTALIPWYTCGHGGIDTAAPKSTPGRFSGAFAYLG